MKIRIAVGAAGASATPGALVVLASAQTKCLGPGVVGDRMEAEATVERAEGTKPRG